MVPARANAWSRLYGISAKDVIGINHVMSVLFYCNFSDHCYEFSASFRRIYWNETDQSLKKRHSEFAQWAKLLRETIECYGISMKTSAEKMYYHGLGKEMLFQSTKFHICGPFSTTSRLFTLFCTFSLYCM